MAFSKYFFEQHGESLKDEVAKYEAREEKQKLSTTKCKHKDAKIERNMLVCKCGAFWQGRGIDKLKGML